DPLGGARYYGVGNGYMGILLGGGLVVAGAFWEWRPTVLARLAGLAVLAGLVVVLGSPRWGANVGGTIASLFGAAYLLLRLGRRPPRWSHLLLLATGTLAAVGLVGLVEALLVEAGSRSHLGQLVARILQEGWRPLGEVALRKAATNLKLVQYTIWSRVLIATLIAFVILLYRPVGLFRQLTAQKPYLGRGIEAALVGALVALVANDSGVLAAATAMIPTMTTLLMALRSVRTSAGARRGDLAACRIQEGEGRRLTCRRTSKSPKRRACAPSEPSPRRWAWSPMSGNPLAGTRRRSPGAGWSGASPSPGGAGSSTSRPSPPHLRARGRPAPPSGSPRPWDGWATGSRSACGSR